MNQPGRVHVVERAKELRQQFGGVAHRQRTEVGNQTADRTTADQIHSQQSLIILSRPAVWAQHLRMVEPKPLLTNKPK